MSKLKRLIEAANRKCEMAWKVYSYNPEKDNELVDTSKAFDCIAVAQAHKREILEKNPNYTVEIVAESAQYKFKVGDRVLYEGDKATIVALRMTSTSPYYDVEKDKEKGKQQHPAYECELKPLQESSQKNEDYKNPKAFNDLKVGKQYIINTYKGKEIVQIVNPNYKNKAVLAYPVALGSVQNWRTSTFDHAFYKPTDFVYYSKTESSQKNERVISYDPNDKSHYDKSPNLAIVKKLVKEIEQERAKDAYIRNAYDPESQLSFAYERETGKYLATQLAKKLYKQYSNESTNIDVKNPGVLEVPDGKNVEDLPQSHFEKLVDTKGYAEVIRALTNLEVWNKDKNKKLSSWASNMADKLKKKYRPESAQKSESKVNISKLKNEIQAAVNKYFKDDKDLLEYVHIDIKKDKLGRDILEVRAELGYNDMAKLADHLDKIVTKYDRYAYFDQETSGIMTAVFESAQKNEDEYKVVVRDVYGSNAIIKDAKDINQAKRLKSELTNKYKHSPVHIIKNGEVFKESAQKNETRSYKVTVMLEVPDKMNNRDIEDYIENKVDNSNFGVYVLDVTATRK